MRAETALQGALLPMTNGHAASAHESVTEWCGNAGARALKSRIEQYWRERGHEVMVVVMDAGFHPALRATRFDVRSDMINGLPRRSIKRDQAAQDSLRISSPAEVIGPTPAVLA
jgi:hypothetical protein